jgi:hypothetical protein
MKSSVFNLEKNKSLEADEIRRSQLLSKLQENAKKSLDIITLDIGGTLFRTTKSTLLRIEESFFHAMLSSGDWSPNEMGKNIYFALRNNADS